MPVAAVIERGMPRISSASSAVAVGTSFGSITAALACLTGSVTTAATVTSEPVPAVVGITNSGSIGFDTLSMPTSFAGLLPVTAIAAITFAASIAEPPPTARIASLRCALTAWWPDSSTG
jgi:hypothetical protein